jgi:serine/threonine protein kinase
MNATPQDWKQLFELLDRYFEVEESRRTAWLAGLTDLSAGTREHLLKLIDQRIKLEKAEFLAGSAAMPSLTGMESLPGLSGDSTLAPTVQRANRGAPPQTASEAPPPCVGMVLNKHFTLVEEIGHGGMGTVFKAKDRWAEEANDRNPYVAIKVLNEEFSRHPDAVTALQREAKRAHTLAHPNVICVYQFDRDGPYSYMTMEYLEGHPLDVLLATEFAGGIGYERAWPIIRAICAALEYGHTKVYENKKGIVHSDLKPSNVYVCKDGTVKLLDFGISRPMGGKDEDATTTQFDPGKRLRALTPAYASLEMWTGESPAPSDDIYALGCITYELIGGHHPFGQASARDALAAGTVPKRLPDLNRTQWEALRKTLAFRRSERTVSVGQFVLAFAPKSFLRRNMVWVGAGALAAVAAVLATGAYSYRSYLQQDLDLAMPEPMRRHVQLSGVQRKEVSDYLTLAGDNLKDAKPELDPQDLSYILTDGPNNVDQIVNAVLRIEPDNKTALEMKATMAALYEQKARQLSDAGRLADALPLIKRGLVSKPNDRGLMRLQRDICNRDMQACVAAADDSGTPP